VLTRACSGNANGPKQVILEINRRLSLHPDILTENRFSIKIERLRRAVDLFASIIARL
jgi:hypothetical protein